jgi:hypothetical protein
MAHGRVPGQTGPGGDQFRPVPSNPKGHTNEQIRKSDETAEEEL